MRALSRCGILLALPFVFASASKAEDFRLNGASTTVAGLIDPLKGEVEKVTGLTFKVSTSTTGKGLVDLEEGRTEMALTSEPLDIAVETAKSAGKEVKIDSLKFHEILSQEIYFVVHPSNPISKLSFAQLKDIHLGKIKNWKEVGGPDLAITVFLDAPTGGTRAQIKKVLLEGQEYASTCKTLENVKRVNSNVADFKGGIGGVGAAFVDRKAVKVLESDNRLMRPLGFITKGDPNPKAAKVIAAFKDAAAKLK